MLPELLRAVLCGPAAVHAGCLILDKGPAVVEALCRLDGVLRLVQQQAAKKRSLPPALLARIFRE